MQITIEHIAALEAGPRAAEAIRVGHVAHPTDVASALRRAFSFLEERYQAIPQIGSVDLFGDTMNADTWHQLARENNDAAVRVRHIARVLGIYIQIDE